MYLFLDRLMEYLVDHLMVQLMELPIYLTMYHLMGHLMDHPMDHLMELPMDILMDCSTDKNYQPYGYGYQQPAYSSNYGFVASHNQGTLHHNASMQPFMGQMGGGYYPTGQGHGVHRNQPYMNQSYQGAWHRLAQPRLPFLATLNLPDLSRLTNDPVSHDLA